MTRTPQNTVLYIVVPCYNESEGLSETAAILSEKLQRLINEGLNGLSKILFVNDGSTDNSWDILHTLCENNSHFLALSLAHNRGHQNALYAGLMYAKDQSDAVLSIDADLQQDVEAIDRFLAEYYQGNEIVYGVRNNRATDDKSKKGSADFFYSFMHACGANILRDAADYRLLSKKALFALAEYSESNLFLRGIVYDIGMKSSIVHFDVFSRKTGKSKYTLRKMLGLAIDGVTSFTFMPLHVILAVGIICFLISLLILLGTLISWVITKTAPGFGMLQFSIWLVGGLILMAMGVIGEYLGRTFFETKHRPKYYIDDAYLENKDKEQ